MGNCSARPYADALDAATTPGSDFDPPHAGSGTLFPLNRGLFQAAGISEDLASTEAVAAHGGPGSFVNAIEEFAGGDVDFGLVEALCEACVDIAIVSGTHVGNVDGQLRARPPGPGRGRIRSRP